MLLNGPVNVVWRIWIVYISEFKNLLKDHISFALIAIKEVWYKKKLVDEMSLNFPDLFTTGTYVKIRFKNRWSPRYFLSSRDQKIKTITKIVQKKLFLFTFLVSFFMAFLTRNLIYSINTWFNFMFGSFFEQDYLLNLFILGVCGKRWPKCACISIQKLM